MGARVLALLTIVLVACQPGGGELAEIREQQKQILARLEEVEKEQQARPPGMVRMAPDRGAPADDRVYPIDVGNSPVLGNPDAKVTVVQFSDFECPYCARSAPLLRRLLEDYGDDVRLVYKHFPLSFHAHARPAAIASLAAQEQDGFWEMHDALFRQAGRLQPAEFPALAEEVGLDADRFRRDVESKWKEYQSRIDSDYALGLKVDVRGTPSLFVNGRKVRPGTLERIRARIDAELRQATSS
jgi:protein-disulfide isomerase